MYIHIVSETLRDFIYLEKLANFDCNRFENSCLVKKRVLSIIIDNLLTKYHVNPFVTESEVLNRGLTYSDNQ